MSDEHTVEVVVDHEAEAPKPEPKGEAAPAAPAKGGDSLADLAARTREKVAAAKAAAAQREAEKAAAPKDEHEASELDRLRADAEAAQREITTLRGELAQAHREPVAWLARCGVTPAHLLGLLSRADLHADIRQHVQALEQRHAQEHAHLTGRADAAQRDLDRIASENAVIDAFEADRDKYAALSEWVDKRAARERISPHKLLIREFLEEVGRLGDAPGLRDGRITDADILDRLNDRYSDVAPPARSRRSETRRAADEDERPGKAAPPTLSNAQASQVTAALPIDLDAMDDRTANRHLGAFAKSIGLFKNT